MQVDTAANGTVSRQRGGGDGRVSFFFSRSGSTGPRSASMSPGWWTTGRTNQPNHADL